MSGFRQLPLYCVAVLAAAAARAAGPSGAYSGTYTCGQESIPIQLTVNTLLPDGTIGATIALQPPSAGKPLAFRVRGRFTTSTNQFQVLPMQWETRPVPAGHPMFGLTGVYDPAAETLTGNTTNRVCGPVTLSRDKAKTAAIQEQVEARNDEIRNAPPSAASSGRPPEACLALLRWVSRAAEEYADTYRTDNLDQLHLKLLNLYADDYFVPFFGKPVDQMTRGDLAPVNANLEACSNSPRFRDRFHGGLMAQFIFSFRPGVAPRAEVRAARGAGIRGRVGADEVPENRRNTEVGARRRVREEFHRSVEQLNGIPALAGAYQQAVALDKDGHTAFAVLWPSEFKTFEKASAGARSRSGEPLLVSRVNVAIGAAKTRDTILKLDQVAAENRELYHAVGAEIAKREDDRLAAALHQGLVGLMANERQRIDGLGTGLAGIEAGVTWYRDFNAVYLRVSNDEAVKAALSHFADRRKRDLSAAAAQVVPLVKESANAADLQSVEHRYVLESDRAAPAAAPIFSALVDQRWQIARDTELLKFSDWERKHMIPNTLYISADDGHIPSPTAREIGLAFLRSYAHNGGRILGPNTVTVASGFGGEVAVIELKDSKVEECVEKDGGYDCRYRLGLKISSSEGMKDFLGRSIQANMLNAKYAQLNSLEPKPVTDRFIVENTGWVSPSRDRKIQADALSYWEGFMEDLKSAACTARVARGDRSAWLDPACSR